MQIVIDLDERIYNICKGAYKKGCKDKDTGVLAKAIGEGTILPDNHGSLIDSTKIRTYVNNYIEILDKRYGKVPLKDLPTWKHCELRTMLFRILNEIEHAPTIIEADTESEDNNEDSD